MDVEDARLKRHAPWLMALLTLIWGSNWPVITLAVREVSAWTFRALTLPVAGLLLLLLARRRKLPLAIPRQHWPMLLCSAWAFLALWNVATTLALTYIPSGQAALLGFTMPLWAALWSWLLFGHTLDGRQWLALLLGTAGVIVLMIPAFASYAHAPLGLVYGLASGAGWALSTVLLKHRPIPVPTTVLTGWQLLLASVPVIIGAWLLGDLLAGRLHLHHAGAHAVRQPAVVLAHPVAAAAAGLALAHHDSHGGHGLGRHRPERTAGLAAMAGHAAVGLGTGADAVQAFRPIMMPPATTSASPVNTWRISLRVFFSPRM